MKPIRVMLVDDHVLFRRGVAGLLSARRDMEMVAEAGDGLEANRLAGLIQPDVILLDIGLPDISGLDVLFQIKENWPAIRVVMLTISDDDRDLFTAIKHGADGYLLKNLQPKELFDLLHSVQRGEAVVSGVLAAKILEELRAPKAVCADDQQQTRQLSDREMEVLRLVAAGKTNPEIAQALCVSENTVKAHVRSTLDKLHLQNRVQAAVYAVQHQLVSLEED